MCPLCSKVACQKCLRAWVEDHQPECPHCRHVISLSNFAECQRFISDVKHLISALDRDEKLKEKCSQHNMEMQYFCEDCKVPICPDCGMFGDKHRGHQITHLTKIYQANKTKVLNQLNKFDQKIEGYRKSGYQIKLQMQRLHLQMDQKRNFVEEYFIAILEQLREQFKEKEQIIKKKYDDNTKQIQFMESVRQNLCQDVEGHSENQLIKKSEEFISYIQLLCDKAPEYEYRDKNFDTIHEIVPRYNEFEYILKDYRSLEDGVVYSDVYNLNGIEWRLKIYPHGNGLAKETHLSVFLEMSKGIESENKYEYKIQLLNQNFPKDSIIREYSSTFDIGQCWGYNQFIPIQELQGDFFTESGDLVFRVSVRNPSYRSLVRDQQNYIEILKKQAHKEDKKNSSLKNRQQKKVVRRSEQGKKERKNKKLFSQRDMEQQLKVQQEKQENILSSFLEVLEGDERKNNEDERLKLSKHLSLNFQLDQDQSEQI